MKAVQLHAYGGVDQLHYEDVPTPQPGPGEVLVKVAATSINPVDWKIRSGAAKDRMPVEFPAIPGRDVAGEVTQLGSGVTRLKTGDKVMGLVNRSYAEFLTAKADILTLVPDGLDLMQAAALPLVVTTGAQLADRVEPSAGKTILVTGALGSVGRTALFVAKQNGARVLAGVRANQKQDAQALGADAVVAIDDDAEINALPELDGIADTVNHEVIGKLLPKLKAGGILGSVLGKPAAAEGKNIRVEAFMAQPDTARLHQLAEHVRDGKFTIPIAQRFPLREVAKAQALAESGGVNGKILVVP